VARQPFGRVGSDGAALLQEIRMTSVTRLLCCLLLAAIPFGPTHAQANSSIRDVLPAARAGDRSAQYMAGMTYLFGQGVRQDVPEGVRWLEASARNGVPQAMVALAALSDAGAGVPFDPARADDWRRQAAKLGDPTARAQLAEDSRLRGHRDFRRASTLTDLKFYAAALPFARNSADAGSASGQLMLGRAHHFGLGVPVDKSAALKLYLNSSAGGLADGSRAVGYMYEFGNGVPVNRKEALVYYDLAAARGSKIARQNAANLRSPDYDRPPGAGGGGSGSQSSDFQAFQCNGAGGSWNGYSCKARNSNTFINLP
jgi:TPR repeat protein